MKRTKPRIHNAPPTFRSPVWQNFGFPESDRGVVDKQSTICKLCSTVLKYTGNTTNMQTHLNRHHPAASKSSCATSPSSSSSKFEVVKKQTKITDSLAAPYGFNSAKSQHITNAVGQFLAVDMRPFSVIESPGFKQMVHALDPRYKIPSRTHFSEKVIPDIY